MWQLLAIYLAFMLLSLTGALSPGPLTTMAISEGARSGRLAGTRLALGHALVEIPMVFGIAYGLGAWLVQPIVRGVVGVIGAAVLWWMGYGLIVGAWQGRLRLSAPDPATPEEKQRRGLGHVAGGMMLTLGNPYWSFWWVTVGAGRITDVAALNFGPLAIGGLALTHWLTDLGWLGGLSLIAGSGRGIIGDRVYRGVLLFCGVFLVAFGVYLGWSGLRFLGVRL
ncbi:MAG TPA: LysE family translocator [Anaerolineae bacterium]